MIDMPKQFLVTGAAVGLAVLVLVATFLLSDRPAPTTAPSDAPGQAGNTGQTGPSKPSGQTGSGMAAALDPDAAANGNPRINPLSQAGRYHYQLNQDGKLIELFGERLKPLPQGVYEVSQPGARIHLIPGQRVIQMRAPRGRFVAPENQPQSGDFQGRVVITLFDAPPGQAADLSSNSPHIRLRTYLDSATFDVELGMIESQGPVHLTGPRVDFRGTGLSITYNTLLGRIEQLRIEEARTIRIKTDDGHEALLAATPQADEPGNAEEEKAQASEAQESADQDQLAALADAQYYRARLLDNVRVQAPQLDVRGDALEIVFAMEDDRGEEDMIDGLSRARPQPTRSRSANTRLASLNEAPVTKPAATAPAGGTASLFSPSDDDVVITLTGPLVLTPEPGPSPDMTAPGQAVLAALGSPAVVTDEDGRRIEAASVRYVTGSGRVAADGSLEQPLYVTAPDLGELTAQRLWIDPTEQQGQVIGPGQITALAADADPTDAVASDAGRTPASLTDLTLTWGDRLDLAFTPKPTDERNAQRKQDEQDDLGELTAATFNGDAVAEHPRFILRADALTVRPEDPANIIIAAGNVQAQSRETPSETRAANAAQLSDLSEIGQLTCGLLTVQLNETGEAIRRVVAEQDAVAAQPGRRIASQRLVIDFDDPPAAAAGPIEIPGPRPFTGWRIWPEMAANLHGRPPATQPTTVRQAAPDDQLVAERVTAEGSVVIEIDDDDVTLTVDRLVAIRDDKLHLFGSPDRPAALSRYGGQLTGQHLVFDPVAQTARVNGPGVLTHNNDRLALQWSRSMLLDNRAGQATFTGQVQSRTLTEGDTVSTQLTAPQLSLTFPPSDEPIDAIGALIKQADTPRQPGDDEPSPAPGTPAGSDVADSAAAPASRTAIAEALMGDRPLQRMVASGDKDDPEGASQSIEFIVERWVRGVGGQATSRVRVKGPTLIFDNAQGLIAVEGPGSMLLQENRPDGEPDRPPGTEPRAAAFTGEGTTVFVWDGAMRFDANENDATLTDKVRMVHRPAGEQDILQMDCEKVVADLTTTGGIPGWLSGRGVKPQLQQVRASGGVFIKSQQRRIRADVLDYLAQDRTVELVTTGGRMTEITFDEQRAPLRAERFRWHLDRDRYEILRPGAGRIGVGDTAR